MLDENEESEKNKVKLFNELLQKGVRDLPKLMNKMLKKKLAATKHGIAITKVKNKTIEGWYGK